MYSLNTWWQRIPALRDRNKFEGSLISFGDVRKTKNDAIGQLHSSKELIIMITKFKAFIENFNRRQNFDIFKNLENYSL